MNIAQQIDKLMETYRFSFDTDREALKSLGYSYTFFVNKRLGDTNFRLDTKLLNALAAMGYRLELVNKENGTPCEFVSDDMKERIRLLFYSYWKNSGKPQCRVAEYLGYSTSGFWILLHRGCKNMIINRKLTRALDVMGYELVLIDRMTGERL